MQIVTNYPLKQYPFDTSDILIETKDNQIDRRLLNLWD